MKYTAKVWTNDGPDRFERDDLERGHWVEGDFAIEGVSAEWPVEAALEHLWSIGNKMEPDLNGRDYPRTERSLSVGDAAEIDGKRWAVAGVGWKRVDSLADLEADGAMEDARDARTIDLYR